MDLDAVARMAAIIREDEMRNLPMARVAAACDDKSGLARYGDADYCATVLVKHNWTWSQVLRTNT